MAIRRLKCRNKTSIVFIPTPLFKSSAVLVRPLQSAAAADRPAAEANRNVGALIMRLGFGVFLIVNITS